MPRLPEPFQPPSCFYCGIHYPEHDGVCCRCEHSGRSHAEWSAGGAAGDDSG